MTHPGEGERRPWRLILRDSSKASHVFPQGLAKNKQHASAGSYVLFYYYAAKNAKVSVVSRL